MDKSKKKETFRRVFLKLSAKWETFSLFPTSAVCIISLPTASQTRITPHLLLSFKKPSHNSLFGEGTKKNNPTKPKPPENNTSKQKPQTKQKPQQEF